MQNRKAIGRLSLVVIVIIILAVVGAAAYGVILAPGSSTSSRLSSSTTTTLVSSSTPIVTTQTTTPSSITTSSLMTSTSLSPMTSQITSNSTTSTSSILTTSSMEATTTSATPTTSSSSSTTATTLSTSCTTTTSTQPASVIIPLLNACSALTQTFVGTINGTASNFTASYTVVHVNSTTYQVNIVDVLPSQTYYTTVWFLKDGTVVALDLAGHNFTGSSASTHFQTYFSPWEKDIEYGQLMMMPTSLSLFHSTGTSTVTLGPSTFAINNYTANSLPETIVGCNGQSITPTTAGFSIGTPSGSSYPLITYIDVAGSETTVGVSGTPSTTTYSFTAQITSVTVA